jgi:periplasmic protein TonB
VSAAVVPLAAPLRRPSLFPVFLGASLLLHAGFLYLAAHAREVNRPQPRRPSELLVVEVEPPPPAPPPSQTELKPRAQPKYTGEARKPAREEPPPPNDAPPPDPGPPPPVVVGLTLNSTTTASAVAVPVGNTLAGKPVASATAPSAVRPGYAPSYLVDTLPVLLEEINGEEVYPREAKKQGIEGQVVLLITVEADGTVSMAKVVSGPGHGLDEAARDAVLRARFKPATKGGKPVATELRYLYDFALN